MFIVAIAVIGGGGWWMYSQGSGLFAGQADPSDSQPAAEAGPVAEEAPTEARLTPRERAERFLATNPEAAAISAMAGEFLDEGHVDIGVLLYRRAADAGDPTAFGALGRLHDPASDLATEDMKRPQIAYNFYRKAMAAGAPGAEQAIEGLRAWATEAAAGGNADAAQLLRLIQIEMGAL